MESQKKHTPVYSVEFFPPKSDDGAEKLRKVRKNLNKGMQPRYYSVTFGAGGSTQQGTFDTVVEIQNSGDDAAPHLSCIGATKDSLRDLLSTAPCNL